MAVIINASTSSGLIQTADTSGTLVLQSNGTTQLTVSSTGTYGQLKSGTAVASTSGTSIDFTGIPSWVKRITVMLYGVSLSGSSAPLIQIGAGSVTTSGYVASTAYAASTNVAANLTATSGFPVYASAAAQLVTGVLTINLVGSNFWVSGHSAMLELGGGITGAGKITLGGTLDRVRITTVNGTDTFDAGSINILYEG